MRALALVVLGAAIAAPLVAQVTATQPTEEQARAIQAKSGAPQEMCPLQLDIELEPKPKHLALLDRPIGQLWSFMDTKNFICDKAQVQSVSLTRVKEKRDKTLLRVVTGLTTDWFRQDVDLTVQLLVNGEVKQTKQWASLTIGNTASSAFTFGSRPKAPEAEWWVPTADLQQWFAPGQKPSLRLLLVVEK